MTDTNEINFNTIKIYFMQEIHKNKKTMGFLKHLYLFLQPNFRLERISSNEIILISLNS